MRLITLAQAKLYCRIDTDDGDDDVLEAIEAASAMVVDHLGPAADSLFLDSEGNLPEDSNGDADVEVPAAVQGATKRLVALLLKDKDGDPGKEFEGGRLPASVRAMLGPLRSPVLA